MEKTTQPINKGALPTLVTVFFFWGFVAASNGIFIPFCKTHFNLDQFQSQLIDTSFYGAYFFGSLILYLLSAASGVDILNRIGYKNGIILGLSMSVIGAISLAFVATGTGATFGMVLACFFIIALGFSLQQTAAQPFALALGNPATGAHRLNFAGGVNSLGTLLGPIAVSVVLFGDLNNEGTATIESIRTVYLILAGLFLFVALFLFFSKNLPAIKVEEHVENSSKAMKLLFIIAIPAIVLLFFNNLFGENEKVYLVIGSLIVILGSLFYALFAAKKNKEGWGAMQYPQLVMGMIAIFVYVGMEVTVQSNMGALLRQPEFGGLNEHAAGATAGVEDHPALWLQQRHQRVGERRVVRIAQVLVALQLAAAAPDQRRRQIVRRVVGAALAHTDIPVLAIPELSTRTRALGIRGALTGHQEFEKVFTGVVRSTVDGGLQSWLRFYRNSLDNLESGSAAFAPIHAWAADQVLGSRVLDLGSCFGFFPLRLSRKGIHVTATDLSAPTMNLLGQVSAQLRRPLRTLTCDAAAVPLPAGAADTVTALHLIEHLPAHANLTVIEEALRLARRRVVIAVPFEEEVRECYGHIQQFSVPVLRDLAAEVCTKHPGVTARVFELHGGWLILDR